jgi:amino acid transporter
MNSAMSDQQPVDTTAPKASLSAFDGIAIMVGIVIGIGIFKTPPLIAANVGSEAAFIGLWLAGGLMTLIGALVYAELAAAYPSTGGEYHFLSRALGRSTGFMFAWARISVIQTGAIAAVGFVFGDYAQVLYPLGPFGPAIYAGLALAALTIINVIGTHQSSVSQNIFTVLTVAAIALVVIAGLSASADTAPAASTPAAGSPGGAIGLAMIFVLLTYGGWNEAAYISGEVRDVGRNMIRILLTGTGVIIAVYLLINFAYLHVLGLEGLRGKGAVAADLMRLTLGKHGAIILSLVICIAALSTLNATIFTGARVYHALGRDLPSLEGLGLWNRHGNNPRNAVILQSIIALALIVFGAATREGFQAMVEYTAPVFWLFLLLVGLSFFVLRHREPDVKRPFKVPLYPLTPILFCLTCAYLLYSSVVYTQFGALIGIAVLLLGLPLLLLVRNNKPMATAE